MPGPPPRPGGGGGGGGCSGGGGGGGESGSDDDDDLLLGDGGDGEGQQPEVLLGFVDEPERPADLLRHRFPSKVGGVPAWLDPLNVPTREQLTCGATGRPLRFLLQVYCPPDANPVDAFHRAVYVFVSQRGDKLAEQGAVRALRCQLRRANPFYGDEPAPAAQLAPPPLPPGQRAAALERDPWRAADVEARVAEGGGEGGEGEDVAAAAAAATQGLCPPLLLPELELVVEPEPQEEEVDLEAAAAAQQQQQQQEGADASDVQRLLAAYQARVAQEGEYDEQELPRDLVDGFEAAAAPAARTFAAFQARTARAPEQALRYCFQPGGAPLWPSPLRVPKPGDVPPCPHCGAERVFEFQVMPQLLALMELDTGDPHAPDWGSIAVYSCPTSCAAPPVEAADGHSTYTEEFVWVQPS